MKFLIPTSFKCLKADASASNIFKDIEVLIDFRKFDEIEFSISAASSTRFIKHSNAQESPFILYFKIADLVTLVVLNELKDSDDEKPQRGKTRNWIKGRHERGYFNNIIQELRIEDRLGFREIFRIDVQILRTYCLKFLT